MTVLIPAMIYIILISCLGYYLKRPKPDVIKKKGKYYYNKNFNAGDIVTIPIDAIIDNSKYTANCTFYQEGYTYKWKFK